MILAKDSCEGMCSIRKLALICGSILAISFGTYLG